MKMKKYIALFLIINFVFFAGAWPTYPNAYVDVNGTLVLGPKAVSPEHADSLILHADSLILMDEISKMRLVAAAQVAVAQVAAPAAAHFSLADLISDSGRRL